MGNDEVERWDLLMNELQKIQKLLDGGGVWYFSGLRKTLVHAQLNLYTAGFFLLVWFILKSQKYGRLEGQVASQVSRDLWQSLQGNVPKVAQLARSHWLLYVKRRENASHIFYICGLA